MGKRYGAPSPSYQAGAQWLEGFIREHHIQAETLSHVLWVNQARVWEWLHQQKALPPEVRRSLERWAADGCPGSSYRV